MTLDEAYVTLATRTGMTRSEWDDFFQLAPGDQMMVARSYATESWAQSKDTMAEVLAVLGVLAQIAGAVSGVSGAVKALEAL